MLMMMTMFQHLHLQNGFRNVEQPGHHLHDLVDVAVGARLVDRESVLVIAVIVAVVVAVIVAVVVAAPI